MTWTKTTVDLKPRGDSCSTVEPKDSDGDSTQHTTGATANALESEDSSQDLKESNIPAPLSDRVVQLRTRKFVDDTKRSSNIPLSGLEYVQTCIDDLGDDPEDCGCDSAIGYDSDGEVRHLQMQCTSVELDELLDEERRIIEALRMSRT